MQKLFIFRTKKFRENMNDKQITYKREVITPHKVS